eukprot:scaffold9840_cov139-Isochrysis_galbana.AAC.6
MMYFLRHPLAPTRPPSSISAPPPPYTLPYYHHPAFSVSASSVSVLPYVLGPSLPARVSTPALAVSAASDARTTPPAALPAPPAAAQ